MSGHEGVDGTVVGVNIRGAGLRAVTGVDGVAALGRSEELLVLLEAAAAGVEGLG